MRRLLVIFLALSAFTGTAAAASYVGSDEDGTLSVKAADGTVWLRADGVLVGRFDQGTLRVFDPADGDDLDVQVWGAERARPLADGATTIYSGTNVRFRIIGRFRVRIVATGIGLSAVGQGRVGLNGESGTYRLNGKLPRPLPNDPDGTLFYADLGLPSTG